MINDNNIVGEMSVTNYEENLLDNYYKNKQLSEPLILNSEGNILEVNGDKLLFNIQNDDRVSDILKSYSVSTLEEKISKHFSYLIDLDEGKNIPYLNSVTFFSSKNSNKLLVFLQPSLALSKEQLIKMTEEFLNNFLVEYLFSKNNTSYNNSIVFFEKQHLEHTIPINNSNFKTLKF